MEFILKESLYTEKVSVRATYFYGHTEKQDLSQKFVQKIRNFIKLHTTFEIDNTFLRATDSSPYTALKI